MYGLDLGALECKDPQRKKVVLDHDQNLILIKSILSICIFNYHTYRSKNFAQNSDNAEGVYSMKYCILMNQEWKWALSDSFFMGPKIASKAWESNVGTQSIVS